MATLIELFGFEQGLFDVNGGGLFEQQPGALPTSVSGRTQGLAVQCSAASGGTCGVGRDLTSGNILVGRFYFKYITPPSVLRRILFANSAVGGRPEIQFDPADNTMQIGFVGGTFTKSVAVVNDSAWHRVDFKIDLSVNPRTFDAQLDGVALTQATLATAASAYNRVVCGEDTAVASAQTIQFDDCAFSATAGDYPLGGGKVVGIRPGSDGTHSFTAGDFKYGDAGANISTIAADVYTMLDDLPWDTSRSTTDCVSQQGLNAAGYCEIAPSPTPETLTANGVVAYLAYSSLSATLNSGKCEVRNAAAQTSELWGTFPSTTRDYSETVNFFKRAVVTKPVPGWTPTQVNAIRWRLGGSDVPIPTWQALMLEADYPLTPPPPPPPIRRALRRSDSAQRASRW